MIHMIDDYLLSLSKLGVVNPHVLFPLFLCRPNGGAITQNNTHCQK